ncbi:MAG: sialate O-acetylesterase [Oscillospiraceae bacterium]|nr:sialate O-acetylesterase [Oscillospiraceae bacterium]
MSDFSVMRFFGSHMVLQSGVDNTVFGKAPCGSQVTLTIKGSGTSDILKTVTDNNGRWEMVIPPYKPSFEPFTLVFSCGGEDIVCDDVLFGELYHISGQSNMELPISRTLDPVSPHLPQECEYIREFRVPVQSCFGENEEYDDFLGGHWERAVGEPVYQMSGAGFYFAREIYEKYNVPVGLVNTAAGGAPVEARMPCSMLRRIGGYDDYLDKVTAPGYMENTAKADQENLDNWWKTIEEKDTVSNGIFERTEGFTECTIPFSFRDEPALKGFCGKVWFRKTFVIPDDVSLDDPVLILGAIIDADIVYVNGQKVGETGYMYPPRVYRFDKDILHHGENTVFIRLQVNNGMGAFVPKKRYCLKLGKTLIDLSGRWEYIIAAKVEPAIPGTFFQGTPLSMYAALTAPAFPIRFAGLLWYQAESNGDYKRYPMLFEEFVKMYRERCGYEIPVIFAQLPNFADPLGNMVPAHWANLREAQRKCLSIPKTAMAVTIDTGESYDLHPLDKWDVGKRLAYCAEKLIYDDDTCPGQTYPVKAEYVSEGTVLITFSGTDNMTLKNDRAEYFEIVGQDSVCRTIVRADAKCDGGNVILTFDKDITPEKVRYLWKNDPADIDLIYDGLPVTPFEITVDKK